MRRVLIVTAILVGCGGSLCAKATTPPGRSELRRAFADYMERFVQEDGRVVDPVGGNITTSEGQSYAMTRAVWTNNRKSFDKTREWMRNNLQGGDPTALPSWKWGQKPDGSWGVLDPNPATDADLFVAYALILGAERWNEPGMQTQALAILDKVWETETAMVDGHRVLLPGPWAANKPVLRLNPSYSLPFAYRVFAKVDPEHDWTGFVADTYWMFEAVTNDLGLQPDWIWMDASSGAVVPAPDGEPEQLGFGFESMRVPWTLAAEARWYDEPRAKALLKRYQSLRERYHRTGGIPAVIEPDGTAGREHTYLGLYGALLPAWGVTFPADAEMLYNDVIRPVRTASGWGQADDYYAHNWVWFGLALWSDKTGRGPTPIGRFEPKVSR
ncbi:MAG: glycosyl hydrolase family 8 [Myxococcota bacterium]